MAKNKRDIDLDVRKTQYPVVGTTAAKTNFWSGCSIACFGQPEAAALNNGVTYQRPGCLGATEV
jgi:hypothetical protein